MDRGQDDRLAIRLAGIDGKIVIDRSQNRRRENRRGAVLIDRERVLQQANGPRCPRIRESNRDRERISATQQCPRGRDPQRERGAGLVAVARRWGASRPRRNGALDAGEADCMPVAATTRMMAVALGKPQRARTESRGGTRVIIRTLIGFSSRHHSYYSTAGSCSALAR